MSENPTPGADHAALIGANPAERRRAVIDIGSNSVRLVIYDGPRRAPFPICNEKALCGLGRDMDDGGALNERAVDMALSTLARFRALIFAHGDPKTHVVATAAVREAENGADFVEAVKKIGFDLRVMSGGDEAKYSAFGVVSFEPGASGLVGDMGGGSLELIRIENGEVIDGASLSIGPFRLMRHCCGDLKAAAREAENALGDASFIKETKGGVLYAVGGAWRAIARVHMRLRAHPLPILHHYELPARDAIEICDLISKQGRASLLETPGVSAKRVDTLPYGAIVLKSVLKQAKISRIQVSAGGIREGLLFGDLSPEERAIDPLIAGAAFLGSRLAPEPDVGLAVAEFTSGLFPEETPAEARVRETASLLVDIGAYFHPDLRGEHAFDTALRAPFLGVTHSERAFIALSLFCRHQGAGGQPLQPEIIAMLTEEERKRAVQLGLAFRFASAFGPKAPALIQSSSLMRDSARIIFRTKEQLKPLFEETPKKRLDALAASLDAQAEAVFD